jgi:glycosyltransferase involved in cell wall biosynthesis
MNMKVLVIIPAYNEAASIRAVTADIAEHCDYDFLVINDCSTDDTAAICRAAGINHVNLPVNLGIGGAVQTGIRFAYRKCYDACIQFDGDGQHLGEYLPAVMAPLQAGEANIVTGSRFLNRNDGFQSSFARRLGIRWLSRTLFITTGCKITDPTSGLRAMDRQAMALFANDYPSDFPEPESLAVAARHGLKLREVPVKMRARQFGRSSISPIKSIYYMIKVSLAIVINGLLAPKPKRADT